jgi:type III pantothenate kinase
MQSGIYFGYMGLIEKITANIKQEYKRPMLVVATGGLASLFYDSAGVIDHLDANLTIDGLNIIYRNNSN